MKKIPILLVMCILTSACSDNKKKVLTLDNCPIVASTQELNGEALIVCHPEKIKDTIDLPLSTLVDKLEIVRLDTAQNALTKPADKVIVSDRYLGIIHYMGGPLLLFERATGKYIGPAGNIGQGPGEYNYCQEAQFDEKNNHLYLFQPNKVLLYDFSGKFTGSYPLSYRNMYNPVFVDQERQRITCINAPNTFYPDRKVWFWVQNLQGDTICTHSGDRLPKPARPEMLSYNDRRNNSFYIWQLPAVQDSLYTYDAEKNRIIPRFTVDWKKKSPAPHILTEIPGYFLYTVYPSQQAMSNEPLPALISKTSLKGAYVRIVIDELGNIPLKKLIRNNQLHSNSSHFSFSFDPLVIVDEIENLLRRKNNLSEQEEEKLRRFARSVSPNDNSYVLVGKWK